MWLQRKSMNIKKALTLCVLAMVGALGVVVLVWIQLQTLWFMPAAATTMESGTTTPSVRTAASNTQPMSEASTQQPAPPTEPDGLPVSELPLSDSQRQFVERLGFDVDTMVLRQAVIDCARATLGESRYQQILAGDTPNTIETARLLPCLGR